MTPALEGFTLAIDAAASLGTVAVLRHRVVLAEAAVPMRGEIEERLFPAVAAALAEAGCAVTDIRRVVCGAGPGSFTSLRVAAALAKGVALGNSVAAAETPLYSVSSLALIVAGGAQPLPPGKYLALLDAMRSEKYAELVELMPDGCVVELERPNGGLIPTGTVADWCAQLDARALGPDETLLARPHARGVAVMLEDILAAGPVQLDSWEPAYGRLAEAQVRWEAQHGRALHADGC